MKRILLSLATILTISMSAQTLDCTELFISEYVEGWSQNKAIEVYNPTSNTIDLSNYKIERYANGTTNSSSGGITTLSGMLAPGDVFVLTNGETDTSSSFGYCDASLIALGDMAEPNGSYPTPMHMNGNDAMVLTKNGAILDVIGRVGEDPASGAWTDDAASGFTMGTWWTAQHTLIRKNTVVKGDYDGLDLFNPSLEWDSLPVGTWNNLGTHTCDCITNSISNKDVTYVMYPNPTPKGENVVINSKSVISYIKIYNMLGEKIISERTSIISTEMLLKGTYLINIYFEDGKSVRNKLIIE